MTDHQACPTSNVDTGDVVLHRPSGEKWTVACVQGEYLSWCGWPEGEAKLSDCDLVRKATPGERLRLLHELAAISESDHRQRYAAYILEKEKLNV